MHNKKGVAGEIPALITSFIIVSIIIAALIASSFFISQPKTVNIVAYNDEILDREISIVENGVDNNMTIFEATIKYQKGDDGFEKPFENAMIDFLKKENTEYLPEDSTRKKVCIVLGVKKEGVSKHMIILKNFDGGTIVAYNGKSMVDLDNANMKINYGIEELPKGYFKVDGKQLNVYSYIGRCAGGSL